MFSGSGSDCTNWFFKKSGVPATTCCDQGSAAVQVDVLQRREGVLGADLLDLAALSHVESAQGGEAE